MNYKRLNEKAVAPFKKHPTDAGWDLTATSWEIITNPNYGYIEYGTGIAMQIPPNHVGMLFPRSSVSETGLILANCVGIIDDGYTGEIKARFKYIPGTAKYDVGDRVCQLVIIPYNTEDMVEVTEFENTLRGEKGFGSTNVTEEESGSQCPSCGGYNTVLEPDMDFNKVPARVCDDCGFINFDTTYNPKGHIEKED